MPDEPIDASAGATFRSIGFDLKPILKGTLIELYPLQPGDLEELYAVAKDPKIWEQHPKWDRYKREVFEQFFAERLAGGGSLLARDAATGQVIGSSSFKPAGNDVIEIGWTFLARSHWGGRYNGEMKRLMLQHAFRHVDRVIFLIGPGNLRSRRAVEKIGATYAGEAMWADGMPHVVYAIEKSGFAGR